MITVPGFNGTHGRKKYLKPAIVHGAGSRVSMRRSLWTMTSSGASLRASQLGALNINYVAFENIARTRGSRKWPLCHQTQGSLGVYRFKVELCGQWILACRPWSGKAKHWTKNAL